MEEITIMHPANADTFFFRIYHYHYFGKCLITTIPLRKPYGQLNEFERDILTITSWINALDAYKLNKIENMIFNESLVDEPDICQFRMNRVFLTGAFTTQISNRYFNKI